MNKIFAKFMASVLTVAMVLPAAAFAADDAVGAVQLSDDMQLAVVDTLSTSTLKESFYADVVVDDDGFVFSNSANDSSRDIDMHSKGTNTFIEGEHANCSDTQNYDKNIQYCVATSGDGATVFKEFGGKNAIFTTYYHATKNTSSPNKNGCINVYVGKAFPFKTATEAVVEVDYYANSSQNIRFRYSSNPKSNYVEFKKAYDESEGPKWTTKRFELTDFYPDADDTGLGSPISGKGADGTSDASFRFEARGDDLAINAIRVFTPGYTELKDAIDSIEIANANIIKENFEVPVSYGDVEIQWTSSNSAISIDAQGYATVTRSPNGNISGDLTAKAVYGNYYMQTVIPTTVFTSNETQAELDNHIADFTLGVSNVAKVSESFALPVAPDGYEYEWYSTNDGYIDVSDGVTAVVNASNYVEQATTILLTVYHGDKYAELEFELSCPALYKEVKGSETIVHLDGDEQVVGNITFDGNFGEGSVFYQSAQIPVDQEGNPYGTKETYYLSTSNADYGNVRGTIGGKDVVLGGNCYSTRRIPDGATERGGYFDFNIPIDVGAGFTAEDKNLTIEIEYFDNVKGSREVRYQHIGADGTPKVAANNSTITLEGNGEWKVWKKTVTDAYFVESSKTSNGVSGYADIRIQGSTPMYISRVAVYNNESFREIAKAKDDIAIQGVDLTDIKADFELPLETGDGMTVEWSSADSSIIDVQDGVAYIYPSLDEKLSVTLIAAVVKDGAYSTKEFKATLAKLPKKSPAVGEAEVVVGDTETTISYTVENTDYMLGQKLSVVAVIEDAATGEIIAKKVEPAPIDSNTTEINVTIQNAASGQKLSHYVVNELGALVKNRAPSVPGNVIGKSSRVGGKVTWDAAGDDYNHVVYDVYKDGVLWIEGTEETQIPYEPESATTSSFYVVARDHEELKSEFTKTVNAGKYQPLYWAADGSSENDPVTVMEAAASYDRGVHIVEDRTGADTVDGDGKTPVTLKAMATYSSAERKALGVAKDYATRMQFKAEGVIPAGTPAPHHVVIYVKYFDEGTGNVDVIYSQNTAKVTISDVFKLENKKVWKEVRIEIPDGNFTRNTGNGVDGADFYFKTNANNGIVVVNRVMVIPYEFD